ncbi:MAG: lipid-A-disaccharide synthase [Rhodobiaceae bacterium]|nr:lipid-A-disaccharide synthase [Rhodobiaceae bacterium]OUT75617.1 MAG: lipid-A-disaccharide synthase [Rhizobiales bacterium TMED25]
MLSKKIAIIAGEPSGDIMGAELIHEFKYLYNNIEILGVGGKELSKLGLKSIFPIDRVSYIGPWDIIKNVNTIRKLIKITVDTIIRSKPDILVIIDCPEFSHRVAKRVRRISPEIPIVNYVSPTIWAWRQSRATKMSSYIDHVLSILPFEPELYQKLNGPMCTYVGNPLSERVAKYMKTLSKTNNSKTIDLVLMAGSRKSEVSRLLAPSIDGINRLNKKYDNLVVKILTFEHFHDLIIKNLSKASFNYEIITQEREKYRNIINSDLAIVASGSATLELAIARLPMVVIYKTNIIFSIFRFFIKTHSIVLPNIIHGSKIITELFQLKCNGFAIANVLQSIIENDNIREDQVKMHNEVREKIFSNDKSDQHEGAKIIYDYLK